MLLKDNIHFVPVGSSEFRTENIPFDSILKTVKTVTSMLPSQKANDIQQKWDDKREDLDRVVRRRKYLPKMDILSLPKQVYEEILEEVSLDDEDHEGHVITGKFCDEEPEVGVLSEVSVDDDVCVYTSSRKCRPWVWICFSWYF